MLTEREHKVIEDLGTLWGEICQVVAPGPTRDADLQEMIHHVHALQHTIMAQAAARAFPENYRLLGSTIRGSVPSPAPSHADRNAHRE